MSRRRFYPYPRLSDSSVEWGELRCEVDGRTISPFQMRDAWDSASTISFAVQSRIDRNARIELGGGSTLLILIVTSADTAASFAGTSAFVHTARALHSTAQVSVSGADISTGLEVRSQIVLEDDTGPEDKTWLSRRIIAESPRLHVPLDSLNAAFPTTSQSFKAMRMVEAPWEIHVMAEDPGDAFANSVLLVLNEDYPLVQELMAGVPRPHVEAELNSAIVRTLVLETGRLAAGGTPRSLDALAEEHPYSLAAAAQRATRQFLKMSLDASVSLTRSSPARFDSLLASGTGLLREKS